MTLDGVMAVAIRYFTEFGSFLGALRKSIWRHTDTLCGRNVAQRIEFLAIYYLLRYSRRLPRTSALC